VRTWLEFIGARLHFGAVAGELRQHAIIMQRIDRRAGVGYLLHDCRARLLPGAMVNSILKAGQRARTGCWAQNTKAVSSGTMASRTEQGKEFFYQGESLRNPDAKRENGLNRNIERNANPAAIRHVFPTPL
jgi:hypothetical protein